MKDAKDTKTIDFVGVKRGRGRPADPDTPTPAERQRARRAKLKEAGEAKSALYVELPLDVLAGLDRYLEFRDETKAQCIERLIRTQLLRKR